MLKNKLLTLPLQPGCYLMKDKNGTVIYVGKAKKLKNRVNSYFHGVHNNKTTKLVANIVDFDYIVTPSEKEALILEYNLIKQYKPRFNIVFMDDASYPYIRLTKEKYPTLQLVRDRKKMKNAIYFGPYPNVLYARDLLSLLEKLYPLRKCKTMPAKVCLYYHIGLCLGPCEYEIDESQYRQIADGITSFLQGDTKEIKTELIEKRDQFSEAMMFEKAQETNELIKAIDNITGSQYMQSNKNRKTMDVFDYIVDKGYISITGLLYSEGKLLHKHSKIEPLYDEPEDYFVSYVYQYYQNNPLPKQLILDATMDLSILSELLNCEIIQPKRGDKIKLLNLAKENSSINLNQKFEIIDKETTENDEAMQQLQQLLNMPISRIELYDNSHISGADAVASQVVYIDGMPSKKDYRHYKVTNGNNDTANMKEVLYRRLFRAIKEKTPLPDLIIVDGGVQQIEAAVEIRDALNADVRIAGLVKNDKHQTSELMSEQLEVIEIDRQSPLFFMLSKMQDEVHRFAISFHQKLHLQHTLESELLSIKGVGPKIESKLKKHFGSIHKIANATVNELNEVCDLKTAQAIVDYYHRKGEKNEIADFDF